MHFVLEYSLKEPNKITHSQAMLDNPGFSFPNEVKNATSWGPGPGLSLQDFLPEVILHPQFRKLQSRLQGRHIRAPSESGLAATGARGQSWHTLRCAT